MSKLLEFAHESLRDQPYAKMFAIGTFVFVGLSIADPAFAQAQLGQDIFKTPTDAACGISKGISTFAMAIGLIGIVCCFILGFFGKLNWKWLITAGGSSFGIAMAGFVIKQMSQMGATGGGTAVSTCT